MTSIRTGEFSFFESKAKNDTEGFSQEFDLPTCWLVVLFIGLIVDSDRQMVPALFQSISKATSLISCVTNHVAY